jgi:oligopeptide transport system substrate-binding protein
MTVNSIALQTTCGRPLKSVWIDIVYTVPINQFAQLKKTLGSELDVSPQLATYYYEFNTTRPPFNDARVRKALNLALDKDIIADKVLGQGQRPAWLISR